MVQGGEFFLKHDEAIILKDLGEGLKEVQHLQVRYNNCTSFKLFSNINLAYFSHFNVYFHSYVYFL